MVHHEIGSLNCRFDFPLRKGCETSEQSENYEQKFHNIKALRDIMTGRLITDIGARH